MSISAFGRWALDQLTGDGLEIGAFHSPLPVPAHARVTYADAFPTSLARRYFEEVPADTILVEPQIVAPAHALPLKEASQDFVISSHLIEHLPDPLAGLREWHRVLRDGGALYLVVPDQRATPDAKRPRTTLGHLIADFEQPADHPDRRERDREHFRSWARTWNGLTDPRQVEFWAQFLERSKYPIHFHCWQPEDYPEILTYLGQQGVPFEVAGTSEREDGYEFSMLLRKRLAEIHA